MTGGADIACISVSLLAGISLCRWDVVVPDLSFQPAASVYEVRSWRGSSRIRATRHPKPSRCPPVPLSPPWPEARATRPAGCRSSEAATECCSPATQHRMHLVARCAHPIVDAAGVPLAVRTSPANVHDPKRFATMLDAIPAVSNGRRGRPRRRPHKVHADKGGHRLVPAGAVRSDAADLPLTCRRYASRRHGPAAAPAPSTSSRASGGDSAFERPPSEPIDSQSTSRSTTRPNAGRSAQARMRLRIVRGTMDRSAIARTDASALVRAARCSASSASPATVSR